MVEDIFKEKIKMEIINHRNSKEKDLKRVLRNKTHYENK